MAEHQSFSPAWFADVGARAAVLVALGVSLGVGINYLRPAGVVLAAYEPPTSCAATTREQSLAPIETMTPEQVAALCGAAGIVVADVRDEQRYANGHVAGALHLPCSATANVAGRAITLLASNHTLVVYGDSADHARRVAESVRQQAARPDLRIIIMDGGFEAWSRAGLACASGACAHCTDEKQ